MDADSTAVVAVRPEPRLLHGALSSAELTQVTNWIGLNAEAVIGYLDGELSTVEFVRAMRKV